MKENETRQKQELLLETKLTAYINNSFTFTFTIYIE